jgi:hypothetical protein
MNVNLCDASRPLDVFRAHVILNCFGSCRLLWCFASSRLVLRLQVNLPKWTAIHAPWLADLCVNPKIRTLAHAGLQDGPHSTMGNSAHHGLCALSFACCLGLGLERFLEGGHWLMGFGSACNDQEGQSRVSSVKWAERLSTQRNEARWVTCNE